MTVIAICTFQTASEMSLNIKKGVEVNQVLQLGCSTDVVVVTDVSSRKMEKRQMTENHNEPMVFGQIIRMQIPFKKLTSYK